ncbi:MULTISPECIES: WXG100 family type VII secretion target [Micromonospora]|uniref:ESAT-6-like protein n=1 Tax=Micromonospora humi TaxID=745366 RepID=A0A1C5IM44_9ACTN|nr:MULTISPECIES: WXG100 family type VII secretion target [Micromonospora]MCZ7440237.1 WXG100 family type VII secretion target [Micromonospora sp. WMMC241]MDG4803443.1 WXG100 family type VII secretion target [Micromonospora sp. WMMD980]SCG59408.1 WXG100 family type VII secretion target [Micromonospora humi]
MEHGVLVVNFAALQQAGADIQRALTTLESQLGQLERDAAPLVASWNGEAREAYEQRQSRWRAASQDMQAMLRDIKLAVEDSAADYLDTEKRNANLFH